MATTQPDPLPRRVAEVAYVLAVAAAHLIWLPVFEVVASRIRR